MHLEATRANRILTAFAVAVLAIGAMVYLADRPAEHAPGFASI